ncbi:MAG: DUF4097 family beta strand repeat-containing protein [Actinomycetales bacterium]|nr:DUF4097 family beta strand repeat-containing protein [Actinomycetales bacterium]
MEPRTYETPSGLELELRIPAGDLVVRTLETDRTTVRITGERDADDVTARFDRGAADGPATLVVAQRRDGAGWRWSRQSLTVEVTAPTATRLTVESSSADLRATGVLSALVLRSASGDVMVEDVLGDVELRTASGDVRARSVGGALTASTASGDVWVDSVGGDVSARTASGDVSLGESAGIVRVTTASGDVSLGNAGPGATDVRTVSGQVEVGVAPGTRSYLDVSSLSGATVSDLPVSDEPAAGAGPDLEVRVSTTSGSVRIRRGSGPRAAR